MRRAARFMSWTVLAGCSFQEKGSWMQAAAALRSLPFPPDSWDVEGICKGEGVSDHV